MPEVLGGDDRQVAGEVAVGEVDGLLALVRDADGGHADVELAVGDGGEQPGEVLAGEDDLVHPGAVGDVLEQFDVEAGEVTLRVGERVGLRVAQAGDADGARLDQPVRVVGRGGRGVEPPQPTVPGVLRQRPQRSPPGAEVTHD